MTLTMQMQKTTTMLIRNIVWLQVTFSCPHL